MMNTNKIKSDRWNPLFPLIAAASFFLALFLVSCRDNQEPYTAFTGVNLVPMTDEVILEDQTVLIKGARIKQIGPSDQVQLPWNTKIIPGDGYYLMPGLADMHIHTRKDWEDPKIWPVNPLHLYLANGVTTVRDFGPYGSLLTYVLQWRDEIESGNRIGPTIYTSGKILFASPLEDPEEMVQQNYDQGFDFLKLYSYLSKEDFQRAMETASELEMYTAGHIPFAVGLDGVLAQEMDEIAHVEEILFEFLEFERERDLNPKEWIRYMILSFLMQLDYSSNMLMTDFDMKNSPKMLSISHDLRNSNTPVCTTMIVDDLIYQKLFQPEDFLARPENIYQEKDYLDRFQQGDEKHLNICRGVEEVCEVKYDIDRWILKNLHDGDVVLLLGTDSGTGGMGIVPGFSIHDELNILVENGFTPYEAMATGTVNAGIVVEQMTGENSIGTIEEGKRADLILVRGNPLEDVEYVRDPIGVIASGRWYSEEMLIDLLQISEPTD